MSSPSTPRKNPPPNQNRSKMTRAVVANLNRQKTGSEGNNKTNGTPNRPDGIEISPGGSPSRSSRPSPQKSLPPQPFKRSQSKELPDVPEYYIVRPAPSTPGSRIERNDRRVFINRGTMEKINVYQ